MFCCEMKFLPVFRLVFFLFLLFLFMPVICFLWFMVSMSQNHGFERSVSLWKKNRAYLLHILCRWTVHVFQIEIDEVQDRSSQRVPLTFFHYFKKNASNETRLIVANHISYLDILAIGSLHPCIFLAKSEIREWPVIGFIARALGCEFVDRSSLSSRVAALFKIRKALRHTSVCAFPEGTTSARRVPSLTSWNEGQVWTTVANCNDLTVVGLQYDDHEDMIWIDDMTFLPHFLKVIGKGRTTLRVRQSHIRSSDLSHVALRERSRFAGVRMVSHCRELWSENKSEPSIDSKPEAITALTDGQVAC